MRIELNEDGATTVVLKRLVDAGVTSVKTSLPSLEEVLRPDDRRARADRLMRAFLAGARLQLRFFRAYPTG